MPADFLVSAATTTPSLNSIATSVVPVDTSESMFPAADSHAGLDLLNPGKSVDMAAAIGFDQEEKNSEMEVAQAEWRLDAGEESEE